MWMSEHKSTTSSNSLPFADSKKLILGNGHHFINVMGTNGRIGYSSLGAFYGMKLHTVMDHKNQICAFGVTLANVYDLTYAN
jgi:Transposase DDE domain